jgi:hypothetical protein
MLDDPQETVPQANVTTPEAVTESVNLHEQPKNDLQKYLEPSNAQNGGEVKTNVTDQQM